MSGTTKKGPRKPPSPDGPGAPPRQLGLFDLLRPWIEPIRRRKPPPAPAEGPPRERAEDAASPAGHPGGRPPAAAGPRRRVHLRTCGRCCDLALLLDDLNQRFFGGALTARITWGRRRPRRRPRRRRSGRISMQLGSYHPDQDLIRIHPALDRPWVPRYVLEAIIHHELLHAAMPPTTENGRRRLHTPEFRRREREYPEHRRAQEWIRENLRRLIDDA